MASLEQCEICYEQYKANDPWVPLSECKHFYHKNCLLSYVKYKLYQEKCQQIPCPQEGCIKKLNLKDLENIYNQEIIDYSEKVRKQKKLLICKKCDRFIFFDKNQRKKLKCANCGTLYCPLCRNFWHFRVVNCQTVKLKDMDQELILQKGWRQCPKCALLIEQNKGCDHVTCVCKFEMCFRCGKPWQLIHKCFN